MKMPQPEIDRVVREGHSTTATEPRFAAMATGLDTWRSMRSSDSGGSCPDSTWRSNWASMVGTSARW